MQRTKEGEADHHEVLDIFSDPRIREMEFGNLQQNIEEQRTAEKKEPSDSDDEPFPDEVKVMGSWGARFCYRPEKAESPADVYVAAQFCAVSVRGVGTTCRGACFWPRKKRKPPSSRSETRRRLHFLCSLAHTYKSTAHTTRRAEARSP